MQTINALDYHLVSIDEIDLEEDQPIVSQETIETFKKITEKIALLTSKVFDEIKSLEDHIEQRKNECPHLAYKAGRIGLSSLSATSGLIGVGLAFSVLGGVADTGDFLGRLLGGTLGGTFSGITFMSLALLCEDNVMEKIENELKLAHEKKELVETLPILVNKLAEFQDKWESFQKNPQEFQTRTLFNSIENIVALSHKCRCYDLQDGVAKLIFIEEYSKIFPKSSLSKLWESFKITPPERSYSSQGQMIWDNLDLKAPTEDDYLQFFGFHLRSKSKHVNVVDHLKHQLDKILKNIQNRVIDKNIEYDSI